MLFDQNVNPNVNNAMKPPRTLFKGELRKPPSRGSKQSFNERDISNLKPTATAGPKEQGYKYLNSHSVGRSILNAGASIIQAHDLQFAPQEYVLQKPSSTRNRMPSLNGSRQSSQNRGIGQFSNAGKKPNSIETNILHSKLAPLDSHQQAKEQPSKGF